MATTPEPPTEHWSWPAACSPTARSSRAEMGIDLSVGGRPPALVDEIALPSGARLAGSALHAGQGRPLNMAVVLDGCPHLK